MMQTINNQLGLGAIKATGGAITAATITQIPALEGLLQAIGAVISGKVALGLLLVGLPPEQVPDTTPLWTWLMVAGLTHQAVYWLSNRKPPPAAADGAESGV